MKFALNKLEDNFHYHGTNIPMKKLLLLVDSITILTSWEVNKFFLYFFRGHRLRQT